MHNGVAHSPIPETEQRNGKITFRMSGTVLTIVSSFLFFVIGWAASSIRAQAVLEEKVNATAQQVEQKVSKDEFNQFQTLIIENQRRIESELVQIREQLASRR
jgi:hypothetical protein